MIAIDLLLKCSPYLAIAALAAVVASSWRAVRHRGPRAVVRSTGVRTEESASSEFAASLLMLCVCLLTFCGAAYFFSRETVLADDDQWLDRLAGHASNPQALQANLKPERKVARNLPNLECDPTVPVSEESECSPPDETENAASASMNPEAPCEDHAQL
ncbi:MAG: hypothetical protein HY290_09395 [Planctomycetia bacterium]|nr:hypothetical protein [Planctomycetia bacterium]